MQKGERLSGDLVELQHLWAGSEFGARHFAQRLAPARQDRASSTRCWPKRWKRWTVR